MSATDNGADTTRRPIFLNFARVKSAPVDWLWELRIPLGALTLLDGDPGLGKSTLTVELASRVSQGVTMPFSIDLPPTGSAGVLLLNAEDDAQRVVRPRLEAAGAVMQNVHLLDAVRVRDYERPPVLPDDLLLVENTIEMEGVKLVVVDPLMAHLGDIYDSHKDQDIRRCLHHLKRLAERCQVAILVVRHLNKTLGGPALYRGGGSVGIIGACRSGMVVGRHPTEPNTMVLASTKSNLGPPPASLTYTIESVGGSSKICWGAEVDLTADDILAQPQRARKSKAEQCAEVIRRELAGGPDEGERVKQVCKAAGFSENAIREGCKLLNVHQAPEGFGGTWMWSLPEEDETAS